MKVKNYKQLYPNKFLNLFELEYETKNGDLAKWIMSSRGKQPKYVTGEVDYPDAVVIVAYHKDEKRLVATKEFRVPLNGYELGLPAGLIDEGELIDDAAKRELKEETGLDVTKVLHMSAPIFSSTGMTDECVMMVYVECEGDLCKDGLEASEDIDTYLITQEEAMYLVNKPGVLWGAKAWFVFDHFAKYGTIV